MTPKKRLGRGLDALLSKPVAETAAVTGDAHAEDSGEGLRQLPVFDLSLPDLPQLPSALPSSGLPVQALQGLASRDGMARAVARAQSSVHSQP